MTAQTIKELLARYTPDSLEHETIREAVSLTEAKYAARVAMLEEAVQLAAGILDYVRGDAWERECTEDDRTKFDDLMGALFSHAGARDARCATVEVEEAMRQWA